MSSINIKINKTTKQVEFKIDDRVKTEEMSEKIAEYATFYLLIAVSLMKKMHFAPFTNI